MRGVIACYLFWVLLTPFIWGGDERDQMTREEFNSVKERCARELGAIPSETIDYLVKRNGAHFVDEVFLQFLVQSPDPRLLGHVLQSLAEAKADGQIESYIHGEVFDYVIEDWDFDLGDGNIVKALPEFFYAVTELPQDTYRDEILYELASHTLVRSGDIIRYQDIDSLDEPLRSICLVGVIKKWDVYYGETVPATYFLGIQSEAKRLQVLYENISPLPEGFIKAFPESSLECKVIKGVIAGRMGWGLSKLVEPDIKKYGWPILKADRANYRNHIGMFVDLDDISLVEKELVDLLEQAWCGTADERPGLWVDSVPATMPHVAKALESLPEVEIDFEKVKAHTKIFPKRCPRITKILIGLGAEIEVSSLPDGVSNWDAYHKKQQEWEVPQTSSIPRWEDTKHFYEMLADKLVLIDFLSAHRKKESGRLIEWLHYQVRQIVEEGSNFDYRFDEAKVKNAWFEELYWPNFKMLPSNWKHIAQHAYLKNSPESIRVYKWALTEGLHGEKVSTLERVYAQEEDWGAWLVCLAFEEEDSWPDDMILDKCIIRFGDEKGPVFFKAYRKAVQAFRAERSEAR